MDCIVRDYLTTNYDFVQKNPGRGFDFLVNDREDKFYVDTLTSSVDSHYKYFRLVDDVAGDGVGKIVVFVKTKYGYHKYTYTHDRLVLVSCDNDCKEKNWYKQISFRYERRLFTGVKMPTISI